MRESPAKRVCDLGKDLGVTLLEFAEKFNLDASRFATLEDARRDELLVSAVICRTDQLLERINGVLETGPPKPTQTYKHRHISQQMQPPPPRNRAV